MTDLKHDKTLVQLLEDNHISQDVLGDEKNPDYLAQKERLIYLLKSGQITEKRIEALLSVLPSAYDALKSVSNNAKDSQIASIDALIKEHADAYKVILKIVEDTNSDELRKDALKTVEKMSAMNNSTQSEISLNNNSTFKYVAGAILGSLLLLAGQAAAEALKNR